MVNDGCGEGLSPFLGAIEQLYGIPGVKVAILATEDGLTLVEQVSEELDGESWAAAAAAMAVYGQRAIRHGEPLELMVVETSKWLIVVRPAKLGHIMVAAEPESEIDVLVEEIERSAVALELAIAGREQIWAM